jgi:integrase
VGLPHSQPGEARWTEPQPPPRGARIYTPVELKALVGELDARDGAAVTFAAATGLRPAEWAQLKRRDDDGNGACPGARHQDGPLEA